MKNQTQRMQMQLGIIKDMGYTLDHDSVIVDLGCGAGNLVNEYRKHNYQAYGCDFEFKDGPYVADMQSTGIIRKINTSVYRLPFDDSSVDFLISDQVFEHVKDYPAMISEIDRVLKPRGMSLHFFPSRYRLIEPHVFVPFASMIQKYYWLKIWGFLGVRTDDQKGLSAKETADQNYDYLINRTSYLTRSELRSYCNARFSKVRFCEDVFFKYIKRAPFLYDLSKVLSFLPFIYSTIRTRVLFFSK